MAANAAPSIRRDGAAGSVARSTVVISSLTRPPDIGASNGNRRCLFGGPQDDGGLRRSDPIEPANAFGEQLVEGRGVPHAHLQHEAVFTGDVVNFLDLWHRDER